MDTQHNPEPELTPYPISNTVTLFMSEGQDKDSVIFKFFATFFLDTLLIAYSGILEEARLVSCQALEFTIKANETTSYELSVSYCNDNYSIAVIVNNLLICAYLVKDTFTLPEIELELSEDS